MQFLVLVACTLAVASAGHVVAPVFYAGAQHLPVINGEGVPVDTADVQHAKAAHLSHKVNVAARNGDVAVVAPHYEADYAHHAVAAPVVSAYAHHAYPTTAVHPVAVNGVPQPTPEVAAATHNHFVAHAEALARTGYPSAVVYRARRGVAYTAAYAAPVAYAGYAHHAPVVASTYGHGYGFPYAYAHY